MTKKEAFFFQKEIKEESSSSNLQQAKDFNKGKGKCLQERKND